MLRKAIRGHASFKMRLITSHATKGKSMAIDNCDLTSEADPKIMPV